tara:strand:- start:5783 stop:5980 length:198 start_codon:yes stop_codon:yes gene_type:complete
MTNLINEYDNPRSSWTTQKDKDLWNCAYWSIDMEIAEDLFECLDPMIRIGEVLFDAVEIPWSPDE